jgi:hypothetical protein
MGGLLLNKYMKAKLFWICLFILPLGILVLAVYKHNRIQPYIKAANADQLTRFQQFSDKWSALPFVPINSSSSFDKDIDGISISNSAIIDSNQSSQLHKSVHNWVFAFHDGTYQSFHDFRVPVSTFTLKAPVQDYMRQTGLTVPPDGESMLKLYWDSFCVNIWTNDWTELNLTHSYIVLQKTNMTLPDLTRYVQETDNMGIMETGPMLTFNETPYAILSGQGYIIYATVCLVPKGQGATFPVFCRFYWSKKSDCWLPESLAIAYSGPRKLVLLF